MQSKWIMVKWGEVLTERKEKPDLAAILTGEIPIVAKIRFNTGKIELREESKTRTNMILIRPGDLVISGINAAKRAIAVYEEENMKPAAATIHYSSYIINKEKAEPLYLWYFMRSDFFRKILIENLPNGIKTEVKPKRLLPIEIPLPPLEEQKRIVAKTESLMTRIEEAKRLRAETVGGAEDFFVSTMNRTFNLVKREKLSLNKIFKLKSGKGLKQSERNYKGSYKVYGSNGAIGFHSEYLVDFSTIIIGRKGSAGKLTLTDSPSWPIDTTYYIEPLFEINMKYLFYLLLEKQLDKLPTRSPKPGISSKDIYPIIVNFTKNISTQHRIIAYLDSLQTKLNELRKLQSETEKDMEELVPSILDKAFKGEL